MSQAKSWEVTDAFRERIEPLLREIFRQAIPSHSDPAAIRKDQGDERRPGPGSRKTRRGTHEAVAIIPEHGNHLVRIFDQACTLRVMTGQAFDCLEPAIPARAR